MMQRDSDADMDCSDKETWLWLYSDFKDRRKVCFSFIWSTIITLLYNYDYPPLSSFPTYEKILTKMIQSICGLDLLSPPW